MTWILHLFQSKSLYRILISFVHLKPQHCSHGLQDSVFKCLNISNGINYLNIFEYIKWDVTFEYISALSSKSWIHSGEAAYLFECITFFVQCKKNIYPRLPLSFTMKLENGLKAHLVYMCFLNLDVAKLDEPPPRFSLFGDKKCVNATSNTP